MARGELNSIRDLHRDSIPDAYIIEQLNDHTRELLDIPELDLPDSCPVLDKKEEASPQEEPRVIIIEL